MDYERILRINNCLQDMESKQIFANRILYSITDDWDYILKLVFTTSLFRRVDACMSKAGKTKKKYIAGAGYWGKHFYEALKVDYEFAGFIDNHKKGTYEGLPVIPMDEFCEQHSRNCVYICSTTYHEELKDLLLTKGVQETDIFDIADILIDVYHHEQYFDLPELVHCEKEIFVDCGCYDGMNSLQFVKWAGRSAYKIYAFEADSGNIQRCRNTFAEIKNVPYHLINKGVWDCAAVLNFSDSNNEGSKITDSGENKIAVTRMDDEITEKVTFIKMDIEGAELKALQGAEGHIRDDRPKLAVSVYHKPEDIIEIPEYILGIHPDYKLFLRHYSVGAEETVLYAV